MHVVPQQRLPDGHLMVQTGVLDPDYHNDGAG